MCQELFEVDGGIEELCINGRLDCCRRNRVDGDLVRGELDRQVSRQHLDSAFARAIGSEMRKWQFFVHRADIDDFSRAPRLPKVTHHRLRYKKHALQVDIENGIEIRFGYIPEIRAFL